MRAAIVQPAPLTVGRRSGWKNSLKSLCAVYLLKSLLRYDTVKWLLLEKYTKPKLRII